ncbi:MAG TPA: DUF4861 domain-containing protein, partial [Candidatus Hydrogenedentes bacterium]|nr:DUF4861 domain-containing protein [Candidatus Hydrogenedentota bacterium]
WKGDGAFDVVCDYTDRDGDNDVDEMAFYFPGSRGPAADGGIMVWWGDDIGDDNLLWFDIGYTYNQGACQYRCHFGGDEIFSAFSIGEHTERWEPAFENPFVFYDHDNDGVTEEVIRIEGRAEYVYNLRYSFDADNDATPDSPRDFDVSLNAHAPKDFTFDLALADYRELRGIPTGPFLAYENVPAFSLGAPWERLMLCWDENDLNIDARSYTGERFADPQERWEGVIAKGNDLFKQIGGPDCGDFNKRYEVALEPPESIRLYFTPTDQRLHLYGAEHMWLAVDIDYDRMPDMRYDYIDNDGDGYIDTWRFDADGDGEPDDEWNAAGVTPNDVAYVWADVNAVMAPVLAKAPRELFALDVRIEQALGTLGAPSADRVWQLLQSGFDINPLAEDVRVRLLSSNETWRFYLDLLKDRLIIALKAAHKDASFWQSFNAARAKGDIARMRAAVEEAFRLDDDLPAFALFQAQVLAKYDKPQVAWAEDWVPPNIGWESRVSGYRAYWGQFDFFGKKGEELVMHTFGDRVNYHAEQSWGMDALHVGTACG